MSERITERVIVFMYSVEEMIKNKILIKWLRILVFIFLLLYSIHFISTLFEGHDFQKDLKIGMNIQQARNVFTADSLKIFRGPCSIEGMTIHGYGRPSRELKENEEVFIFEPDGEFLYYVYFFNNEVIYFCRVGS